MNVLKDVGHVRERCVRKRYMFSGLPTIIPSFIVLIIPMNLLKSRKRSMSVGIDEDSGIL